LLLVRALVTEISGESKHILIGIYTSG